MSRIVPARPLLRSPAFESLPWVEHGFETAEPCAWLDGQPVASARQIHSANVLVVEKPGEAGSGDALISSCPGLWVSVRTADCVPVLLADPESRTVAAVHSGWRGTAGNIVAQAIRTMCGRLPTAVLKVHAAIGPSIGGCCYEVGPEVLDALRHWSEGRGRFVDLRQVIRAQLREVGVEVVESSEECTRCDKGFHSFRRDREAAGRMRSAIRVRE